MILVAAMMSGDELQVEDEVLPSDDMIPENLTADAETGTPKRISLVNMCDDEEINKDAKFLEEIEHVMKNNETSQLFLPNYKRLQSAFYDARKCQEEDRVRKLAGPTV